MENEQTAGVRYVCSLLCVFDHQCDVRRQDNILPSICMTSGQFKMYVSIHENQKGFKVALVLLKKATRIIKNLLGIKYL